MKELFKKIVNFASSATTITTFIALLTGIFTAYFGVLIERISIPVWLLIIAVFLPFAAWAFIRHRLQMKKRKYKTGDLVGILCDTRAFTVFEYCIWRPLHVKVKERDGSETYCVQQKFLEDYKEDSASIESVYAKINTVTRRKPTKYGSTLKRL